MIISATTLEEQKQQRRKRFVDEAALAMADLEAALKARGVCASGEGMIAAAVIYAALWVAS